MVHGTYGDKKNNIKLFSRKWFGQFYCEFFKGKQNFIISSKYDKHHPIIKQKNRVVL